MKKLLKRTLIVLAVLLVLGVAARAAWVFWLYPKYFQQNDEETTDIQSAFEQIAAEENDIDFDRESGLIYVNNEVIIAFKENATQAQIDAVLSKQDAQTDEAMADLGIYRLVYKNAMTYEELESLIQKLKSDAAVENAFFNIVTTPEEDTVSSTELETRSALTPNDPWRDDPETEDENNWNVRVPRGYNWGWEAVDAPGAWGYRDLLSDVRLGEIDNTPNASHPDLTDGSGKSVIEDMQYAVYDRSKLRVEMMKLDVTPEDHGTHVAGIMAGVWDNNKGVAGMTAGKGKIYYVRYLTRKTDGSWMEEYATAYTYTMALKSLIDQDVRAINISQNTSRLIGFAASRGNERAINYLSLQAQLTQTALLRLMHQRQKEEKPDFVICVAAGNNNYIPYYKDQKEIYGYREKPTSWEAFWGTGQRDYGRALAQYNNFLNLITDKEVADRIVVVGAAGIDTDKSTAATTIYKYAYFSNVGARVDVTAPGWDIFSCYKEGYDLMSGTSMATPFVTGIAGLAFAANPNLTGPEVKQLIVESAKHGVQFGYYGGQSGMVNARIVVENALKTKNQTVDRVLKDGTVSGLDLCFVIDTTGSMGDDIDNARANMNEILAHLDEKSGDNRVAIIDYRDFPERTGDSGDYACKIQLQFTSSKTKITQAINDLSLGYGGDPPETVYSALMAAAKLDWRDNARKVIIILGDAPPLDPEPITGYTYDQVVKALLSADVSLDVDSSDKRALGELGSDLISVYSVGTGASDEAADFMERIAESTGGSYMGVDDAAEVGDAIMDSIDQIETVQTINVSASLGDSLANDSVEVYSEDNEYLFSVPTDEKGQINLNDVAPGTYRWKSNGVHASGTITVTMGQHEAAARATKTFRFADKADFVREHKVMVVLSLAGILLLCILAPVAAGKTGRAVRGHKKVSEEKKAAKKAEKEAKSAAFAAARNAAKQSASRTAANTVQAAPQKPETVSRTAAPMQPTQQQNSSAGTAPRKAGFQKPAELGGAAQNDATQAGRKFCPYCGKSIPAAAKFCDKCGKKLS